MIIGVIHPQAFVGSCPIEQVVCGEKSDSQLIQGKPRLMNMEARCQLDGIVTT